MTKYIKHFWKSKSHAMRGIQYTFRNEANFRTQVIIAILVIMAIIIFDVKPLEAIIVLLLIFSVLILELLNTAIEALSDVVMPRLHEQIKVVKDISAGMVLLAGILSVIIGTIIFLPYIFPSLL